MRSRYSPAAARGTSAAPASAALTRLPCAARHQLWHLVTPLLRSLLLLVFLPAAARAQAPTVVVSPAGPLTLCAGSTQTLLLQGTGGSNPANDVTAFVDKVEIARVSDGMVVTGALFNAGFENSTLAPWSAASASFADSNSPYSPPPIPEGSQAALLQRGPSSLSQPLTLAASTYQARFFATQRSCCTTPYDQDVVVNPMTRTWW